MILVEPDAIFNLSVADIDKKIMFDFDPVGYAVTYIFRTIGCAFILSIFDSKMIGVDLKEERRAES